MDHGQMAGEMYLLWLYKDIDAGLWMMNGYFRELGMITDTFAYRIAIQIGCHLVSFGSVTPGWGTADQPKEVARVGRDIIVNALRQNLEWFRKSELAGLFEQVADKEGGTL